MRRIHSVVIAALLSTTGCYTVVILNTGIANKNNATLAPPLPQNCPVEPQKVKTK